jgi:tRNA pseudouridine38-40 synthase
MPFTQDCIDTVLKCYQWRQNDVRNIRLNFEYDGTNFWGYQRQREGRTVQGELERVVSQITDRRVVLYAAGRTDTGVHASGQVANFKTDSSLSSDKMLRGINSLLSNDVAVRVVEDVPPEFHARFSALSRRYEYTIDTAKFHSVFNRLYALHVPFDLNHGAMCRACGYLLGEKDFSSFRGSNDMSGHSVRKMMAAGGEKKGEILTLYFEASSFLQHMIRIIVGTLLMVGKGALSEADFCDIVTKKDRRAAGPTAASHGLCLTNVRYS